MCHHNHPIESFFLIFKSNNMKKKEKCTEECRIMLGLAEGDCCQNKTDKDLKKIYKDFKGDLRGFSGGIAANDFNPKP